MKAGGPRERQTFGRPLIKSQVIRHNLVDMRMRIEAPCANLGVLA
ncbi:acyl-CoA dehydrogenase family protein [Fontimonas thermophila]